MAYNFEFIILFCRIKWLFSTSTAYYPSLYVSQTALTSQQMIKMMEGRIQEAKRIISTLNKLFTKPKIVPYIWLKYRDTNDYMTKVRYNIGNFLGNYYLLLCENVISSFNYKKNLNEYSIE